MEGNTAGDGRSSPAKSEEDPLDIIGAVKLMDGLFLGDAICADVILLKPYCSWCLGLRVPQMQ